MATFALSRPDLFPAGTSVAAYPVSNWPAAKPPASGDAPQGTAAQTVTAGATSATFTALTDGTNYVGGAQIGGVWTYVYFATPSTSAPATAGYRGAWTATTAYAANDLVVQAGALYSAKAAFTSASSFDSSNWTAVGGGSGTTLASATSEINVADSPYSADRTGATYANTAIINSLAACGVAAFLGVSKPTWKVPAGQYKIDPGNTALFPNAKFTIPSGVTVDCDEHAVFDFSGAAAGGNMILFQQIGAEAARDTVGFSFLTADARDATAALTVADGTQFAAGDYCKLGSTTLWDPANRDGWLGELVQVDSVVGNTVNLREVIASAVPYFANGRVTPTPSAVATGGIDASVTTIPAYVSSGGVKYGAESYRVPEQNKPGRVQIDSEVITYTYRDGSNFYGCTRGANDNTGAATTPATHAAAAVITELPWVNQLAADITTTNQSTITLNSITGFGSATVLQGYITIDSERIYFTGRSGATLTGCVRGVGGTTAATHTTGAVVTETVAACLAKLTTYYSDITFKGGQLLGPNLTAADNNFYAGIEFDKAVRCRIEGTRFTNVKERACNFYDAQDCTADNIKVRGSDRNNFGYGCVFGWAAQQCHVTNSIFERCRHATSAGAGASAQRMGIPKRLTIENCKSYNSTASTFDTHPGVDGVKFIDNWSFDAGDWGFWTDGVGIEHIGNTVVNPANGGFWCVNGTPRPTNLLLDDNKVIRPVSSGFATQIESSASRPNTGFETSRFQVTSNSVEDSRGSAFLFTGNASAGAGQVVNIKGGQIANNDVYRVGHRNFAPSGIELAYMDGVAVTGNTVHENLWGGIKCTNLQNCTLTGNIIEWKSNSIADASNIGISFTGCTKCAVTGNVIPRGNIGISADNTSTYNVFMANIVRGCTTPLSKGTGTGNVWKSADTATAGDYNLV